VGLMPRTPTPGRPRAARRALLVAQAWTGLLGRVQARTQPGHVVLGPSQKNGPHAGRPGLGLHAHVYPQGKRSPLQLALALLL
jgi:hypothetical protein